jgi:hypothetical protein
VPIRGVFSLYTLEMIRIVQHKRKVKQLFIINYFLIINYVKLLLSNGVLKEIYIPFLIKPCFPSEYLLWLHGQHQIIA